MRNFLLALMAAFIGLGVYAGAEAADAAYEIVPDAALFKQQYEYWNNFDHPANELWFLQEMHIPEENPIRFADFEYMVNFIEEGNTGIIYLGFPSCPWCRVFVPVFLDAARDFGVEEILYKNILYYRNILELRDGEIYETRAGHPYYYKMLEILGDWAPEYAGLGDPGIRRIFVPAFIFVREGEVIFKQGYLDSHTERIEGDPLRAFQPLLDSEIEELYDIFMENFERVFAADDNASEPRSVMEPCFSPC